MEGDDWRQAVLVAGCEHPPVVVELSVGELALGRLDPGPLDPEPERVEAQARNQLDVFAVAVVEVARVSRRLTAGTSIGVLPAPPVAVDVPALDLVSRLRGAEEEPGREQPTGVSLLC